MRNTTIAITYHSGIPFPTLQDNRARILIGCSVPEAHKVLEERYGGRDDLFSTKTTLGWTVRDPVSMIHVLSLVTSSENNLGTMIRNMYDREFCDSNVPEKCRSMEYSKAVKIAGEPCKYENEHFMIGLSWRFKDRQLVCVKVVAIKRLMSLKKFVTDADLWTKYKDVVDNHVMKGNVEELVDQSEPGKWHLPHHPAFNPRKPG